MDKEKPGGKFTYEYVKEYIEERGCVLKTTTYNKIQDKLQVIGLCGHEFNVRFDIFRYGNKYYCNKCAHKRGGQTQALFTIDEMKEHIETFGCKLVTRKINNCNSSINIKCKCTRTWKTTFTIFKRSKYHCCKKCSTALGGKSHRMKIEFVKNFSESLGYQILEDEYIEYEHKMNMIDREGYKYSASYHDLLTVPQETRTGMARFGRRNPYSIDNGKLWLNLNNIPIEIIGDKFSVTKNLIHVKCKLCTHEWYSKWDTIYQRTYCPVCKFSSYEKAVNKYLKSKNINYKYQFKFKNCKSKRALPFDFFFPDLNCVLEVQGQQHHFAVDFGNMGKERAEEAFKEVQIRDKIKKDYCLRNNIRFVEINYWEFPQMEEILRKELLL